MVVSYLWSCLVPVVAVHVSEMALKQGTECAICDSQEFTLSNGLFFCSECGTQSQVANLFVTLVVTVASTLIFVWSGLGLVLINY